MGGKGITATALHPPKLTNGGIVINGRSFSDFTLPRYRYFGDV